MKYLNTVFIVEVSPQIQCYISKRSPEHKVLHITFYLETIFIKYL